MQQFDRTVSLANNTVVRALDVAIANGYTGFGMVRNLEIEAPAAAPLYFGKSDLTTGNGRQLAAGTRKQFYTVVDLADLYLLQTSGGAASIGLSFTEQVSPAA